MRLLYLARDRDVTGVSGVGVIAEGVELSDGSVALHWATASNATGLYRSIGDVAIVHGHSGDTRIEWGEPEGVGGMTESDGQRKAGRKRTKNRDRRSG